MNAKFANAITFISDKNTNKRSVLLYSFLLVVVVSSRFVSPRSRMRLRLQSALLRE